MFFENTTENYTPGIIDASGCKGVIHLAINLASAVIGLFLLYVGFALVYCLVTQRWTDLFIFFVVGVTVIGILFLVVILEETIDGLREKISEI